MNIVELLESDECKLPKQRDNSKTFDSFFAEDVITPYLNSLTRLDKCDPLYKKLSATPHLAREIGDAVVDSINHYLHGCPHEALTALSNPLCNYDELLNYLCFIPMDPRVMKRLFRIRQTTTGAFERHEMFHIPFELRHNAKTQRYSIPGYPCLYMGSSLYVCWKELGCPPFNQINSVRYAANRELKVLNFGYTPKQLAGFASHLITSGVNGTDLENFIYAYLMFWPVIAACSIETFWQNAPFQAEYIIPQLLLQHVKELSDIDGIRYFSLKYEQPKESTALGSNFVFPVKSCEAEGVCSYLAGVFESTEVIWWQLADEINMPKDLSSVPSYNIELVKGHGVPYHQTIFGLMELNFMSMDLSPIP